MEIINNKICSCGNVKIFAKNKCRKCYRQQWWLDNPEGYQKEKEANKKWRENNVEKTKGYFLKYKASGKQYQYYREAQLKRLYGITTAEYNEMVKSQDGKCYICHVKSDRIMHVDHDHNTGKIRKLLCATCNRYIGKIERNISVFERLKEYLNI